jgi:hypothetical protein
MNKFSLLSKLMVILSSVGLVMGVYLFWARPYQPRWGATDEEVKRPMPGDGLNPDPKYLATRAITIEAVPEEIWPWLIQMGYKRAGFYSYDLIENIGSPSGLHSALSIVQEFQHPEVGDELPISPAGGLVFYAIEPNRYLIWSGGPGWGYTWALYPIDNNHTRLMSRARFDHNWSKPDQLVLDLLTEFSEYLGIPKILQGVKGRVEGYIESMSKANAEIAVHFGSAMIYLVAIVLIPLRPLTWLKGWQSSRREWLD